MLYFVSTPVGNLKDISLRALEVLKSVDLIACEDTRTSLKLLNRYDIKKPLTAYHKFNETKAGEKLIEELKNGINIAVITDAGTPVISDPGNVLTKLLVSEGLEYTVIPGATAFVPALILSGLDSSRFAFIGFLPDKKKDREELLSRYKNLDMTMIFYSAPHDLLNDLETLYSVFGARKAAVCKEITKLHEGAEHIVLGEKLSEEEPKGEYVIVVECGEAEQNSLLSLPIEKHILYYMESGLDKKDAVKAVAKDRKMTKSDVYKFSIDL